jgi:hypothetical protein
MKTYNAYLGPTDEDIRDKKIEKVLEQARAVARGSQHTGEDMELLRFLLRDLDEEEKE